MADLRIRVNDSFISELRRALQLETNTDVVRDALTLLKWAVDERRNGRRVVASDPAGKSVVRLALASLDSVKQSQQPT